MLNSDTQKNNVQPPPFCKANVVRSCHVVNECRGEFAHAIGVFQEIGMASDYAAEMQATAGRLRLQIEYRVLTLPLVVA